MGDPEPLHANAVVLRIMKSHTALYQLCLGVCEKAKPAYRRVLLTAVLQGLFLKRACVSGGPGPYR